MHFVKMATDRCTAVVAFSGFFVVAAATAMKKQKKKNGRYVRNRGYCNGQWLVLTTDW